MRLNHGTVRWLMLPALLLVSFTLSFGQNITLNLRNTTVSRAVTEIQKIYGYSVVVKPDGLDMERVVSVSLSGEDVKVALAKIFAGQPVDVEVNGRNVSIMKQVTPSPQKDIAADIKGIIRDENGEPLIGASVLLKGKQGEGTITDFDGAYITESDYCFKMKKLYHVDIPYESLPKEIIDLYYPNGDMHRMYVCEIKQFLEKE